MYCAQIIREVGILTKICHKYPFILKFMVIDLKIENYNI